MGSFSEFASTLERIRAATGKNDKVRTLSEYMRGLDPDDAELHFRKAVLHRKAGQPAEAEACWRRIRTLKRPDQFCSVDPGIYGHLILRNLAVLAEERGDRAEARRL